MSVLIVIKTETTTLDISQQLFFTSCYKLLEVMHSTSVEIAIWFISGKISQYAELPGT